jgi:hypothetical protein
MKKWNALVWPYIIIIIKHFFGRMSAFLFDDNLRQRFRESSANARTVEGDKATASSHHSSDSHGRR